MRTRSSKGRLSALGVTVVAVLALASLGGASASAATQHWYGQAGGTRLAESTPTEVLAKDSANTTLQIHYAGVELDIECNSMSADGSIENPSGGGGGTLGNAYVTFDECVVSRPAGGKCVVPTTIVSNQLKAVATKFEGSPAIEYSPAGGSTFTTFSVSGAECPSLIKGSKTLTGGFTARYQGSEGSYNVSKASSTNLKYGGQPVALLTSFDLESKSGNQPVALVTDPPGVEHWYLGGSPTGGSKTKFAEGSSVSYSSLTGTASYTIATTITGVKFKIDCGPSSWAGGSVENPVGGGAGTAYGSLYFGGCVVSEPAGGVCTVAGGGVGSNPLSGLATELVGAPAVTFSPAEGKPIATFTIGGASCPAALKGGKAVTGALTGVPDAAGTYALSGSGLKYAGQNATASGQVTLQTSLGERLVLAP